VLPVVMSPSMFVTMVAETGLPTPGGPVKLNHYMSMNMGFGGSKTSSGFMSKIAAIKGDFFGAKKTPREVIPRPVDWINLSKGQGNPAHFSLLWSWCYYNVDLLAPLSIDIFEKDKKTGTVKLADVFTRGVAEPNALQKTDAQSRFGMNMQTLVDMKVFGWDCIGFVQQYLISIGFYSDYPGLQPKEFIIQKRGGFREISSLAGISPLCLICYDNHVQIIDSVQSRTDSSVTVTVSQSFGMPSRSGPMTNPNIIITAPHQTELRYKPDGSADTFDFEVVKFSLKGDGLPTSREAMIGKSGRLTAAYPNADTLPVSRNPLFVPGVF